MITGLDMDEFAFGIDNLSDLVWMPFFTIHESDPKAMLLAELTETIKTDMAFWPQFSNRHDELLKQHEICARKPDGFLHFPEEEMVPREYLTKAALLWQQMVKEGYLDGVVNVLEQAGYNAWKNPVGNIAI